MLTATSTLAAGVNLPARRVILRTLFQGVGNVGRAQYLQMAGRAGRAGQSAVGEAFLMGAGPAFARPGVGQWTKVCALLSAPLPRLVSQLVAPGAPAAAAKAAAAGASSGGAGGGSGSGMAAAQPAESSTASVASSGGGAVVPAVATRRASPDAEAEAPLQRLLLESISIGLVSDSASIDALLRSTLAAHQLPWERMEAAALTALAGLRARRLTSLKDGGAPGAPRRWAPAALGKVVYASSLPPVRGPTCFL